MDNNLKSIVITYFIDWLKDEYDEDVIDEYDIDREIHRCISFEYSDILIDYISVDDITRDKAKSDIANIRNKFFSKLTNSEIDLLIEKMGHLGIYLNYKGDEFSNKLKDKMLEDYPSYSDRVGEIHLETDIFYSYDADNRNDYDD
ncbi:hypothetical protein EB155_08410 [archaeon]|nr:hypothetical protein [archaeon]NDB79876.1 hypothetical protein [archaeon]